MNCFMCDLLEMLNSRGGASIQMENVLSGRGVVEIEALKSHHNCQNFYIYPIKFCIIRCIKLYENTKVFLGKVFTPGQCLYIRRSEGVAQPYSRVMEGPASDLRSRSQLCVSVPP